VKARGHHFEYAKRKLALFRATNNLLGKTRYVSRHFRRNYLKANKESISEATRNGEHAYQFRKVLVCLLKNYRE